MRKKNKIYHREHREHREEKHPSLCVLCALCGKLPRKSMQRTGIIYLSLSVVGLHVGLILWLFISFEAMPLIKNRQKMTVKTVRLKVPAPPKAEVKKIVSAPEPPTPAPKVAVKKNVPAPTSAPVKKPAPPKATAKSKTKTKKQELIAKAQESIAKIQKTSDKVKSNLAVPELKLDPVGVQETKIGYRDEIASLLKLLLRLPEYGQVKIKLTLNRRGDFIKMTVIDSESDINRRYIEKMIPGIKFPPFGDNFKGLPENTFSISLSNDF